MQQANLIDGPIPPALMRLTLPMIVGLLANFLFNLVDTFFVSQLGDRPLAAMGFTFPVVFFVTGTAMGMGIGVSSVLSRAIGRGAAHEAKRIASHSVLLAVILVTFLVGIGLFAMNPIFRWMGAAPDLIPMIRSYMVPWFCGIIFIVVPMIGNSCIRAIGDAKIPSIVMLIAGGVNAILNPFLIFGIGPFPRLELAGAAIATVISYVIVSAVSFTLLYRKYHLLTRDLGGISEAIHVWKSILYVGIPSIFTNQLLPVANGILTAQMAAYGEKAVGAWGVCTRVESLMMTAGFAFSTAMAPFAGQNEGAGHMDRIRSGVRFGAQFCFGVLLILWPLVGSLGGPLARLFTDDPETIAIIRRFLWIVPMSYGAFGTLLACTSAMNSLNHPLHATAVFVTRLFVFTIPLAIVGNNFFHLNGFFGGIVLSHFLSLVLAVCLFNHALGRVERNMHLP